MQIGELARKAGVATSAVRYYERMGLLPKPARASGRRVYNADALPRLAVILHARRIGFGIADARQLVQMLPAASPSARWKTLARAKVEAMDALIAQAQAMKAMLQRVQNCRGGTWEECGERLLAAPFVSRQGRVRSYSRSGRPRALVRDSHGQRRA
ncbi:MAG TPA: MerR family transcriptional regulator [Gemmatimonadales bacterium]|jgi:MerR family redox-sensitive transcriptional activator SoxR